MEKKKLIDYRWYKVNGTRCQFIRGVFFFETFDGTKFFTVEQAKKANVDIEEIDDPD